MNTSEREKWREDGAGIRLAPNPSAECEKAEHPHLTRGHKTDRVCMCVCVCVWKEEEPPLSPSGPPPSSSLTAVQVTQVQCMERCLTCSLSLALSRIAHHLTDGFFFFLTCYLVGKWMRVWCERRVTHIAARGLYSLTPLFLLSFERINHIESLWALTRFVALLFSLFPGNWKHDQHCTHCTHTDTHRWWMIGPKVSMSLSLPSKTIFFNVVSRAQLLRCAALSERERCGSTQFSSQEENKTLETIVQEKQLIAAIQPQRKASDKHPRWVPQISFLPSSDEAAAAAAADDNDVIKMKYFKQVGSRYYFYFFSYSYLDVEGRRDWKYLETFQFQ